MNRTRILLALLVLVVLLQLFPERAALIKLIWVGAGAAYVLVWAGARYWAQHKERAARAKQQEADEREYRDYKTALDVLRAQYDPSRDLSDPTSIDPDYRDALSALHDRHQAMLDRKFGPRS